MQPVRCVTAVLPRFVCTTYDLTVNGQPSKFVATVHRTTLVAVGNRQLSQQQAHLMLMSTDQQLLITGNLQESWSTPYTVKRDHNPHLLIIHLLLLVLT